MRKARIAAETDSRRERHGVALQIEVEWRKDQRVHNVGRVLQRAYTGAGLINGFAQLHPEVQ